MSALPKAVVKRILTERGDGLRVSGSALEKAVEGAAPSPSARYRLGTALSQSGDKERAREMFTLALDSGAFPEADAARRELAQLDQP